MGRIHQERWRLCGVWVSRDGIRGCIWKGSGSALHDRAFFSVSRQHTCRAFLGLAVWQQAAWQS